MANSNQNLDALHPPLEDIIVLPGGELIAQAYRDLAGQSWKTEAVLIMVLYTTRLKRLGFSLPSLPISTLDTKFVLYSLLAQKQADPFSAFKALENRLLKLCSFLERE